MILEVSFSLEIPKSKLLADAVRELEAMSLVCHFPVIDFQVISDLDDDDEPEDDTAAAYRERRGYELDMWAALQQ